MTNTINRKQAPPITHTSALELTLKQAERQTLTNGVQVILINAGAQDVLMVDVVYHAGNLYETKNLVSSTTSYMLKCGTHSKTAFEINQAIEYYGAYLNRSAGAEYANITLHSLTKHIEQVLPILQDVMYNATMPQAELDIHIQNSVQRLTMSLQKGDFVANRKIDVMLYGAQHPYGTHSTIEDYNALTVADCVQHYEQYYKQSMYTIFVAGKLPSNIIPLLNQYLGTHPILNTSIVAPPTKYAPSSTHKLELINDPQAVQGAIRIARPYHNRHHVHFKECMVLNTILGGYFGSRLMTNIREDKGYTYGIHSYVQNHTERTAWVISTEAGKDVTPATITEIYNELHTLKTIPVQEEELQLVRNYMMGQLLGDLDGPFQLINRWKTYYLNGLTEAYFNDYVHTIKTITPARIQELANIYLNKEDFYELVVY